LTYDRRETRQEETRTPAAWRQDEARAGKGFQSEEWKREMTESKKQEIRAKLIELGFWRADETGDPLTSEKDAKVVRSRIRERLGPAVYLDSYDHPDHSRVHYVDILRLQISYRIAEGDNYPEAICRAAAALPEFLKKHPECAADQK